MKILEDNFPYAASNKCETWDSVCKVALYLLSSCTIEVSLCPLITICCSFNCFATWDTQSDRYAGSFHVGLTKSKLQMLVQTQTYVFGRGSWDLNPGLGEEGAGAEHEDNVDNHVDRVIQDRTKRLWRRKVVAETADWVSPSWSTTRGVLNKKRFS